MKTKKSLTSAIVVGAFLLNASPSFAIVGIKPTMKAERREAITTIKQERTDLRTTIKQEREVAKTTITQSRLEFQRKRLTSTYNSIKKSLSTRFTYLTTTLKNQIQTKINAQKTAGKDITAAQAKLDSLSTSAYTTNLAAFDAKYNEMLASTDPKSKIGDLGKAAEVVRHDLNDIKKTLMDAFRLAIRAK